MVDLEKPTIEEPVKEPVVEGQEAKAPEATDVDALVKELEKAGVTTKAELQGKLRASQEVGQMANLLGDANKRLKDLEEASKMPPAEPEYDYSDGQPIDIDAIVEKRMNKVLDSREAKTRQIQQQAMQTWNEIQDDEDYGLVKDVWETKIKDPKFNMDIQTGRKNVTKEYAKTVRQYYKGISKRSLETIKALQEGVVPVAPHVEGDAQMPGTPTTTTENETLRKVQEKANTGKPLTVDEEMAALDSILQGS